MKQIISKVRSSRWTNIHHKKDSMYIWRFQDYLIEQLIRYFLEEWEKDES